MCRLPGIGAGSQRALRPRLRLRRARPRSFSWKLVEGDMLRTLDGSYTFDDVDGGHRRDLRPHGRSRDPDPRPGEAPCRGAHRRRRAQGPQARGGGARTGADVGPAPEPVVVVVDLLPDAERERRRMRYPMTRPTSTRISSTTATWTTRRRARTTTTWPPNRARSRCRRRSKSSSPSCSVRCPRSAITCWPRPTSCSTPPSAVLDAADRVVRQRSDEPSDARDVRRSPRRSISVAPTCGPA